MPTFMQFTLNRQALRAELFKLEQRKANQDGMLEVIEYRINQIKEMLK
ncbi:hypothetical protein X808_8790 [Mannheimia varigena USDA-ARS-USMARC-1296]|uniref:Uncharacterized protein n=1 Tax=Mannheimia varigena USDA-ARS-USMARC-1296 TaxID=1433287 RepID=W0QAT9_9PAST|nr:hypothetical protein [Mannheimia varigena]AHG75402.1 hypothetical protein X808_8790 [Mannheimia varigena USDA-ARS-USMARC-1296]